MDLDRGLVSVVLRDGSEAFSSAKKQGIVTALLHGPSVKAWEFIERHVVEHGETPSVDFFTAKTKFELIEVEDDLSVYIKEIRNRKLWRQLAEKHEKIGGLLEKRRADQALKLFGEAATEARALGLSTTGDIGSLLELGPDVIAHYERIKAGERGVLTPWESINEDTLGFWAGDFVVFVARLKIGKTWAMLQMARRAWMDGHTVLFVGTEMSRLRLAIRFYALHLSLPYDNFRRGNLSEQQEADLTTGVERVLSLPGLYIVGDHFNAHMSELESSVDQMKPDILFVDGLYLIKNRGTDRHTMVSNTADDLKGLARTRGIPVVASHQFNREAGPDDQKAITAENVGITDVIGWNVDVLYAMWRTTDMKMDNFMGFKPLALREGEGMDFMSNWNFSTMNFAQLPKKKDETSDYVDDGDPFVDPGSGGMDYGEKSEGEQGKSGEDYLF